jgi:hypothetical protein
MGLFLKFPSRPKMAYPPIGGRVGQILFFTWAKVFSAINEVI